MIAAAFNPPRVSPGGKSQHDETPQDPACLRPYQATHGADLISALRQNRAALDASDTGTGKMYVACWIVKQLGVVPLVIAPKSTLAEWRKVAARFGIEIEATNYEKVRGVRKIYVRKTCPINKLNGKQILGPHLARLSSSDWGFERMAGNGTAWVWSNEYQLVIFDEVHRCGGMSSLNSKLLVAAKRQAEYILPLSATAANDPRQFKALGYVLGLFELRQFRWWLMKHGCEAGVFGGYTFSEDPIEQQAAMAKIHKAIFPKRGARMCKDRIPGFPKTRIDVKLLSDETGSAAAWAEKIRDAYKDQHLKLLTQARQEIELLKVPFFADLAEDYARVSRVILFVNFKKTVLALRQKLKAEFGVVPVIDGGNTEAEREEIKVSFQNNEFPVLICNNQAGGVGIGLHDPAGRVERTSLISPCYNPKDMQQVLGRVPREGGAFSQQYFLYFADTLEERIASAVQQGLQNIGALNDAILNGVLPCGKNT